MKQTFMVLSFLVLFVGCQPDRETEQQIQVELTDAAACMEVWMIGAEAGAWGWAPFATFAAGAIYGAIMSSEAAGNRMANPDYRLPEEYIIAGNPYECIGYAHNRNVDYIRNTLGSTAPLVEFEEGAIRTATDNYVECNPELLTDTLLAQYERYNFRGIINEQNRERYEQSSLMELLRERQRTDTSGVASYVIDFIQRYNNELGNSMDYVEKIRFINDELHARLKLPESDNRKTPKLIFLTSLKHSVYYWR